ncbi:MAG: GTPase [Phycisphaerales bacterium]
MNAAFRLRTPAGTGAIAVIDIVGDVDDVLGATGIQPVRTGNISLRRLADIDDGVVARWSERTCSLMPHGGAAVIRALCAALESAGVANRALAPLDAFPEADDEVEAITLRALAAAESPRAVDLLLAQPQRWRAWNGDPKIHTLRLRAKTLHRLLVPPVVAALGAPNIGKSSLLNALARRAVSIVHDEPGVTRDHVGASLVLDGLAVRWLDTPGIHSNDPDPLNRDAAHRALAVARGADLLVLCADATSSWPDPDALGMPGGVAVLRVGLRDDLGGISDAEVTTSAAAGLGIDDLARAVRRVLVPDDALSDPSPWLFDEALARPLSFPSGRVGP